MPLSPAMQNVEALQQAGALKLLRPLLLDNVPRQGSAAARVSCDCLHDAGPCNTDSCPLLHATGPAPHCKMQQAPLHCIVAYSRSCNLFRPCPILTAVCGRLCILPCTMSRQTSQGHAPLTGPALCCCSIQQSAAMALGHLANYSDDLAEAVVQAEILPQLVYSLAEQNRFYKKAAAYCLRAVAKHSPALAQAVVDCGACEQSRHLEIR